MKFLVRRVTMNSKEQIDLALKEVEKSLDLLYDFLTSEPSGTDCTGMLGEEGETGPEGPKNTTAS